MPTQTNWLSPQGGPIYFNSLVVFGAGEGIRTLDPNLGKFVLQLFMKLPQLVQRCPEKTLSRGKRESFMISDCRGLPPLAQYVIARRLLKREFPVAKGSINKRTVDGAAPAARDSFIWDESLKGFGLKVTPAGVKTYVLQYRIGGRSAPTRRHTIGRHGSPWTPSQARDEARRLLLRIDCGVDPRESAGPPQALFRDYAHRFVDLYLREHWSGSWREAERKLRLHVIPHIGNLDISTVERRHLVPIFDAISSKPGLAKSVHTVLNRLFRWAVSRGELLTSPMTAMLPPRGSRSRERVLSDAELRAIWRGSHHLGYPFGPMIRLMVAAGQRRQEVSALDWSEIDMCKKLWTLPSERSKNGKAHLVPLNSLALAELELLTPRREGLVFTTTGRTPVSGFSKAKERLARHVETILEADGSGRARVNSEWRLHDIRRTLATGFQRLGVRLEVTEAVLNHVSGTRAGIVGVYQRHDWADEKRQALDLWAEHIKQVCALN